MRLLIVDDHEVVREGLVAALTAHPRFEIAGAVATGAAALAHATRTRPDVALVDLRLPDMSGDRVCRELRAALPGTAVVILSSYVSEETVRAAIAAGAAGYITKAAGLAELIKALQRVVGPERAEPQIVEQLHRLVTGRGEGTRLTPQQERVLELSAAGLTYREIGSRLFISESTVRFHMQNVKSKFDARTNAELVAKAIRAGVIPPAHEDMESAL